MLSEICEGLGGPLSAVDEVYGIGIVDLDVICGYANPEGGKPEGGGEL